MQCCSGINGSHTLRCEKNTAERLVCWCCGGTYPAHWACAWSVYGSRCLQCEGHRAACRLKVGARLESSSEGMGIM